MGYIVPFTLPGSAATPGASLAFIDRAVALAARYPWSGGDVEFTGSPSANVPDGWTTSGANSGSWRTAERQAGVVTISHALGGSGGYANQPHILRTVTGDYDLFGWVDLDWAVPASSQSQAGVLIRQSVNNLTGASYGLVANYNVPTVVQGYAYQPANTVVSPWVSAASLFSSPFNVRASVARTWWRLRRVGSSCTVFAARRPWSAWVQCGSTETSSMPSTVEVCCYAAHWAGSEANTFSFGPIRSWPPLATTAQATISAATEAVFVFDSLASNSRWFPRTLETPAPKSGEIALIREFARAGGTIQFRCTATNTLPGTPSSSLSGNPANAASLAAEAVGRYLIVGVTLQSSDGTHDVRVAALTVSADVALWPGNFMKFVRLDDATGNYTDTHPGVLRTDIYTNPGTYSITVPTGAIWLDYELLGAGGGGGTGRRGAAGTLRGQGGPGGGGGYRAGRIPVAALTGAVSLVVGAKGNGAAANVGTSADGATGSDGAATTLSHAGSVIDAAGGGKGGLPGTASSGGVAGAPGTGDVAGLQTAGEGAAGCGGGFGGWISAGNAITNPSGGIGKTALGGGAPGNAMSIDGTAGLSMPLTSHRVYGGVGGGGGYPGHNAAAGAGGNGGFPGGGGGGGGAGTNGFEVRKAGDGNDGMAVLRWT